MTAGNMENAALQAGQQNKARNQSIECGRLVASLFVITAHFRFPGTLGEVFDCLARFTVPFFFAISGYFAFQADERILTKRLRSILRLNAAATLLYLLWGGYCETILRRKSFWAWLSGRLSENQLVIWLIINENPFAGHLWYLTAMLFCYLMLILYVRWVGKPYVYRTLYMVGILLFSVHMALGSMSLAAGFSPPYLIYRNALFYGLPMFFLGIFLREYQSKILDTYQLTPAKLIAVIVLGAGFSVLQWRGTGKIEMPLGALFEVIAMILLLGSAPQLVRESSMGARIISKFGRLSTYVYITHLFWNDIYNLHVKDIMLSFGERAEAYLYPFTVMLICLTTGSIWCLACDRWKALTGKKRI